ncbi:MAG: helix-turn-helix domain-containing protein [Christensenellaceae bacterium]
MEKSKKRAFIIVDKANIMHEGLVIYDKMVLVILCSHADNKTKKCYPSIKKIANEAGCSARQVSYSLKKLESKKIIKIEPRTSSSGGYTSSQYTILLSDFSSPTPATPPAPHATPPCTPCPTPLHHLHAPPAPHAHKLYPDDKTQSDYTQSSSSSSSAAKKYWHEKIDYDFFANSMPNKIILIEDLIDIFINLNEKKYKKALNEFDSLALTELIDFLEKKDFSSAQSYKAYLQAVVKNYLLKQSNETLK